MLPPPPMQFAPPPALPAMAAPDATGAQALSSMAGMAQLLQARMAQPPQGAVGGAMGEAALGGPTDAPPRRKSSFGQAAQGTLNYA